MTRVLLIKTSSMGDVLHALPAVTDAAHANPGTRFDWVVEQGFEQIPAWHPAVDRVLVVATRRWRKNWWKTREERQQFARRLRQQHYDHIIDAQGLYKSAIIGLRARGPVTGFSMLSAREGLAALSYRHRVHVPADHAVRRLRALFSQALGYRLDPSSMDFGIELDGLSQMQASRAIMFLHGTTWASKHWPEHQWIETGRRALENGYELWLPWWSEAEKSRCERIANACPGARILERTDLTGMAQQLKSCAGAIAVDTGLAHFAAALSVPAVSVYGATDPARTGTWGKCQVHVQADYHCAPCLQRECRLLTEQVIDPPCYQSCSAADVWQALSALLETRGHPAGG